MKRALVPMLAVLCAVAACHARSEAPAVTMHDLVHADGPLRLQPPPMRGIALGLHFRDPGHSYLPWLWEMRQAGATHVSLVVSWTQADIRATTIAPEPGRTPADEVLQQTIRAARAMGFEVLLFPILWIETRAEGEWRGRLTPTDRAAWFAAYEAFVLHYARLAQQEQVSHFSVGSELSALEQHEAEWRALIAQVRRVFSGALLYSANWDHWHRTPFWDALDLMGVTAYHELVQQNDTRPDVEELQRALRHVQEALTEAAQQRQRPLVLTEAGYTTHGDAARHPWDYTSGAAVDLGAQADLYEAFVRTWGSTHELHGVYFWTWFGAGGARDGGYTPRNKPAEQWLRLWYGAEVSGAP